MSTPYHHYTSAERILPTEAMSISDDDICSECVHLKYRPGAWSECRKGWPCEFDGDGYAVSCKKYKPCKLGENWEA